MTRALLGFTLATAAYGLALALSLAENDDLALDLLAGFLGGTAGLFLLL